MSAKEFIMTLPSRVNPAAVGDANACFHFNIKGDDGGEFTVSAKDGAVTATEGLSDEPTCVVTAEGELLMDIVNGKTNAMMSVFSGKLKLSNPSEMMKYAKMF
ncbi:MAG: SCP2 sterol-binding domain-containing protein, partial [Candidatus Nanopelagicaceae bacterium]